MTESDIDFDQNDHDHDDQALARQLMQASLPSFLLITGSFLLIKKGISFGFLLAYSYLCGEVRYIHYKIYHNYYE